MKYLELFKQGFDSTLAEKVKVENYPFVGYDPIQDSVRYTELPVYSRIYYTTVDNNVLTLYHEQRLPEMLITNAPVISNKYTDKGEIVFEGVIEYLSGDNINDGGGSGAYLSLFGGCERWGNASEGVYPSTIKSIVLPNTIKVIGGAFLYCSNLESISFSGTMDEWNAIEKIDVLCINKSVKWNQHIPATVVHCTDGDVPLS